MNIKNVTLGKTGITTPQNAFGALPLQRRNSMMPLKYSAPHMKAV